MGNAELFLEELSISPSIQRLLVCSDTMWDGESCHDVLNPYNHVLELPEYMNGESLEEFKKRVVLTPEQDVPIYLANTMLSRYAS